MKLVHRGVRPVGKIQKEAATIKGRRGFSAHAFLQFEILEDGTKKYWNKKTLTSGCSKIFIFDLFATVEGLTYCPYCKEHFNEDQFAEIGETDEVHNPKR